MLEKNPKKYASKLVLKGLKCFKLDESRFHPKVSHFRVIDFAEVATEFRSLEGNACQGRYTQNLTGST